METLNSVGASLVNIGEKLKIDAVTARGIADLQFNEGQRFSSIHSHISAS